MTGNARWLISLLLLMLLTACGTVVHKPDSSVKSGVPLVTFVFDDGNDTDFLLGKKLFADHGAVACSAITTDFINTTNYMTPEQIVALQDAGWEILSHSVSHPRLNWLSSERLDDELSRSKLVLQKMGLTINNVVYPYNSNNEEVRILSSRYYRSGRGGESSFNKGLIDPYLIKSFVLKHDLALMTGYIDKAYEDKSWLVFYLHNLDAKLKLTDEEGEFISGETLNLSPSGTVARYNKRHWFPVFGAYIYAVPFSGVPQAGDLVTGTKSGAKARVDYVMYNDLTLLQDMLGHIRSRYKDMKIVTIDQGLDLLGIPKK